jgi:hypothetical protein
MQSGIECDWATLPFLTLANTRSSQITWLRECLPRRPQNLRPLPRLKAFGAAYDITKLDPEKKDSQYLLFGQWQEMNPEKDLYTELVLVNRELLTRRPFGYVKAALRNLSSLIDGRASFNYYPIENRDLVSKAYFWIQFILDNLFCFFWFVALGYYLMTFRKRNFFGDENLLFLLIASQFLTIAFVGYSELRRQSIGVGSIQIIFVISLWILMCRKRLFNQSKDQGNSETYF